LYWCFLPRNVVVSLMLHYKWEIRRPIV
jgi:hypothetical protein